MQYHRGRPNEEQSGPINNRMLEPFVLLCRMTRGNSYSITALAVEQVLALQLINEGEKEAASFVRGGLTSGAGHAPLGRESYQGYSSKSIPKPLEMQDIPLVNATEPRRATKVARVLIDMAFLAGGFNLRDAENWRGRTTLALAFL